MVFLHNHWCSEQSQRARDYICFLRKHCILFCVHWVKLKNKFNIKSLKDLEIQSKPNHNDRFSCFSSVSCKGWIFEYYFLLEASSNQFGSVYSTTNFFDVWLAVISHVKGERRWHLSFINCFTEQVLQARCRLVGHLCKTFSQSYDYSD